MTKKWLGILMAAGCLVAILASQAPAAKLLCITKEDLAGEETVASCLARGEEFAIVDDYGIVRILSKREVELTRAFNPDILNQRAFGMKMYRKAPEMRKVFGSVPLREKE